MGLLSWLTRSDKGSRGATEPMARAGVDAGTTAAGPDAVTGGPATAGWRFTPPVQRTLGAPMGLVTDPGGFGGRLGTWQDPTVTGPLGHLVSAQAPSGVGHGLAQPTPPVRRTGVRPQAHAFGAPRDTQDPVPAWAGGSGAAPAAAPGTGDRQGDHGGSADLSGDPHGVDDPVVFRSVSPAGDTAGNPGHAQSPAPASIPGPVPASAPVPSGPVPLPLVPLQRATVAPAGPVPTAPVMVMRVPSAPAAPAPARPLVVAEPPDVPARELAAVAPAEPHEHPGPLAPDAPAEPVADLLATPGTPTGRDGEDDVVQRTGATDTARPSTPGATAPFPLAVPRTGTAAGRGPDTATAPLVGGADGTGPAVQRDVTAPPRPRHRGLGEPLSALPPTALPLPGPATPPAGPAASPSVPSGPYVSRTVEEPGVPRVPEAPQHLGVPRPPAAPDAVADPAGPAAPSPGGEGTAPLLGDTPPLTTDQADLGTALPPGTVAGVGAEAAKAGPPAGPRPVPGPGPGPDAVPGPFTGTGGTAPSGPVALQRLDVPASPSRTAPSADVTPAPAEGGRAPLLGDAGPLAVSDPVAPEAPGPGEMVTASTPLPLRRLDAVDEAVLPGPLSGTEGGAGAVARGSGPVFPLVAQRSLPLYTVPPPSAGAPVTDGPPPVVPVRWEPAGGGASASGTGGSGGRARSTDTAAGGPGSPGGSGDHGGPGGGHTTTGGGSAYPDAAPGRTGGVVQRSTVPGARALAEGAPPARNHRDAVPGPSGRPGFPGPAEFSGAPGAGALFPDSALQPSAPLQGPEALGPAVPLQRLATVPGAAPPPGRPSAPPTPPPLQGQEPSLSTPPGVSTGAAAVAAGVARWMPDGSVEFTAPAVQRTEEGVPTAEPPPADPPAQPEPAGPPVAEPPPGTTAQAATPGETGGAGAPKVTDELVRALVAPLSRLLRVELRIERERTGSLMNIRH
ncbi:hypothetical protein ABZ871_06535 [Streptomyces populi]